MKSTCIESFYLSLIYKIFFCIICGYGLLLHISPNDTFYNIHMFSYFTVLTNLFCFLINLYFIITDIRRKIKHNSTTPYKPYYSDLYTFVKGMALMGIILTFLVYHFMVAKYKYPLIQNNILQLLPMDIIAHYVVPLMFVLDWLLFQPKNIIPTAAPLLWLLYPYTYLVTIMTRAFCFPRDSILYLTEFPYFFLDVITLGPNVFIIFILLITFVILAISYGIIGIEKLFCKVAKHR